MSGRRVYSLRHESDHRLHTSLLDNWHHQAPIMAYAPGSRPTLHCPDMSWGQQGGCNINEDDLDCPGHSRHQHGSSGSAQQAGDRAGTGSGSSLEDLYNACLATSSSSEGLCDSWEEGVDGKVRAMSVEEAKSGGWEDDDNINVLFTLPRPEEESLAPGPLGETTPPALTPPPHSGRPERRASVDNGVLGVGGGEKAEEGGAGWYRNAVTEPGTPAEPCTPVASYGSVEQLMADSRYLFSKLQPFLCAERVKQMTRTCSDIGAVTTLLEEREHDLELAAQLGKALLSETQTLRGRREELEEQLALANDTIRQLKHELTQKVQQLEVYDQDLQNQNQQDDSVRGGGGEVDRLQRRVDSLEEDNLTLRLEADQLRSDVKVYEEKKRKLEEDSRQQFVDQSHKVDSLAEELSATKKENSQLKDRISSLVAQLNDAWQRMRQLTEENTDLVDKLQAAEECQTQLSRELSVQKDQYDELLERLERMQDQLRGHQQGERSPGGSPAPPIPASLASELQRSLSLNLAQDDRASDRSGSWRVFETARAAHKAASKSRSSSVRWSSSASSCWDADSLAPSLPFSDTESLVSEGLTADLDTVWGSSMEMGRPGIPGTNDLQAALQRLAWRQGQEKHGAVRTPPDTRTEGMSPLQMPGTPDTVSSRTSGFSYLGCSKNLQSSSSSQYKMSSKLQIVKPMEGSVTLQQWQRLAQPHLGGLFERREGVKVKGECRLDLEGEAYMLSDFEEDEDIQDFPSRQTEGSPGPVWTLPFISPVTHHSSSGPRSLPSLAARASEAPLQLVSSSTPQPGGGRGGVSQSYSMSLGLAAVLQDRDTSLARAIIRSSASCPKMAARSPLTSTTSTSLPMIPAESVATVSRGCSSGLGSGPDPCDPAADSRGLLGKLISNGYSLLWSKSEAPTPPPPPTSPHPLSDDTVVAEGAQAAAKLTVSQVFAKGGGSGVLGAITTLRKNGIL